MTNLLEKLRPKSPSDWAMSVGFLGSIGFTTAAVGISVGHEFIGLPKVLARDIALLAFYAQVLSHGVFTAGFTSEVLLKIGRDVHTITKALKETRS